MNRWLKVVALVLLVLVTAVAIRTYSLPAALAVANTNGQVPHSPWLIANTSNPVPPSPWQTANTSNPVPPSPWQTANTSNPVPPSPWNR